MSEKKYGPNTAEVDAYLALLPKLTDEQWDAARDAAACNATRDAARAAALDAAFDAGRGRPWAAARDAAVSRVARTASWAAVALVTRDLITPGQFDSLTAPMRAAGINFDALATGSGDPS